MYQVHQIVCTYMRFICNLKDLGQQRDGEEKERHKTCQDKTEDRREGAQRARIRKGC